MLIREATVADAAGIARVHVESWRTTYPGIVPDEILAQLSIPARTERWEKTLSNLAAPSFTFVAVDDGGEVIGFAGGGPAQDGDPDYPGELHAIYLLKPHQGQGIGRLLFQAVAARLAERGFGAMKLWALEANHPARRAYEALGGVLLEGSKPFAIGGASLTEVAYGWRNITKRME